MYTIFKVFVGTVYKDCLGDIQIAWFWRGGAVHEYNGLTSFISRDFFSSFTYNACKEAMAKISYNNKTKSIWAKISGDKVRLVDEKNRVQNLMRLDFYKNVEKLSVRKTLKPFL